MKCDLTGKVSLVTGAARGIGQAISNRFAANGSTVYYTDLDTGEAQVAASFMPNVVARVAARCHQSRGYRRRGAFNRSYRSAAGSMSS